MGSPPAVELRVVEGGNSADPDPQSPSRGDLGPWIERAQRDDERAWAWLYRHCYDPLYRYVLYLDGDPATAEDLTQETFVRAMRGIRGFGHRASFSTWLQRIALNVVRRHWRRTRSRRRTVEQYAQVSAERVTPSPEHRHTDASQARALLAALDHLPPKLREAFVTRDLLGMPPSEAAELLGISSGHLAVRGHRARTKIRQILAEQGWTTQQGASDDA